MELTGPAVSNETIIDDITCEFTEMIASNIIERQNMDFKKQFYDSTKEFEELELVCASFIKLNSPNVEMDVEKDFDCIYNRSEHSDASIRRVVDLKEELNVHSNFTENQKEICEMSVKNKTFNGNKKIKKKCDDIESNVDTSFINDRLSKKSHLLDQNLSIGDNTEDLINYRISKQLNYDFSGVCERSAEKKVADKVQYMSISQESEISLCNIDSESESTNKIDTLAEKFCTETKQMFANTNVNLMETVASSRKMCDEIAILQNKIYELLKPPPLQLVDISSLPKVEEYIDPYEEQFLRSFDDELSVSDVEVTWQERVVKMSERYSNTLSFPMHFVTIKLFWFQ